MCSSDLHIQRAIRKAVGDTAANTGLVLTVAFDYGGRAELVHAARASAGAGPVDSGSIGRNLYDPTLPPVDLLVRTSGETRISNFLLMQAAYAEFVFTPVLWPDFTKADLAAAIADYNRRERRFGLTSEQLAGSARAVAK